LAAQTPPALLPVAVDRPQPGQLAGFLAALLLGGAHGPALAGLAVP
jgi:hypothetical protein